MKASLNKKWQNFLISQPETGMGYQVTDMTFKDGTVFKGLIVIDAEHFDLPLGQTVEDITDMVVRFKKPNTDGTQVSREDLKHFE